MANKDKKSAATAKSKRAPRVRKSETVRERNQKAIARAEAKATKPENKVWRTVKSVASTIWKPFKKPFHVITWPFRTRPVRFVGRLLGRIFWPKYFRQSWAELKLVTWPSRKDTWKMTFAVLIFALVFGLAAAGVDVVLDKVIRRIVFRA